MNPRLTRRQSQDNENIDGKGRGESKPLKHTLIRIPSRLSDFNDPKHDSSGGGPCSILDRLLSFWASKSNPWIPYIGDCKALDNYLTSKGGYGWLVPKFINALLRGVGQVVFANNPLTGLIILLSLFWADALVGLAATVAGTSAILTSVIFRQDSSQISAGLTTYNAVLVGSVTASLWTPLYAEPMEFRMWGFIILGASLSVFITTALANMFASFKQPLPCLTLPFNIVALLLFTCMMPPPAMVPALGKNSTAPADNVTGVAMELVQHLPIPYVNNSLMHQSRNTREAQGLDDALDASTSTTNGSVAVEQAVDKIYVQEINNDLHWGNILTGILLSMGQVYGINNLICSILMYFATLVYSPTLFMMSFAGATLGTISRVLFMTAPFDPIYNGIWGYNGILSAISIGGLFFVFTFHSFWTAMANVIFTLIIQEGLSLAFAPLKLPFFTMPFVLSTLLFLSMTATGNSLPRVLNITFPEMHRYEFLENRRINRADPPRPRDTTDEIAEEKELVLKEIKVIMEESPVDQQTDSSQSENDKQTNGQAETE